MDVILVPLIRVMMMALNLYRWGVIIYTALLFLEQFNIINRYNNMVYGMHTFLFRIVEPALVPIRRALPDLGGIDISPMILILIIYFIQMMLGQIIMKFPF